MRPRMRQAKRRMLGVDVVVGNNVDVEGARSPADLADPGGRLLELVAELKQRIWGQRGGDDQNLVEIIRLFGPTHRCSLGQRRDRGDLNFRVIAESLDGVVQDLLRVT